jgi:hypothetical protein
MKYLPSKYTGPEFKLLYCQKKKKPNTIYALKGNSNASTIPSHSSQSDPLKANMITSLISTLSWYSITTQ